MTANIPPDNESHCMQNKCYKQMDHTHIEQETIEFTGSENDQELEHHQYHSEKAIEFC